jgi:tetrahydromethanopterin S-methyltransferase subunit A
MRLISEKINDAALVAKFNSGYYNGKIQGIAIGLFLSLLIFSLL